MVEFAIIVPLLVLLLCGVIDFGLMFGGYSSLESGVASAARNISLDDYQTASGSCSPSTATAEAVCSVVASLGSLTGLNKSTLAVGICFVSPGSSASCGGSLTTGTSGSDDVLICAHAALESTTGLTSIFVSGSTVYTSSRQLLEEPQPPGNSPAFGVYNANSTAVLYNGTAIAGLTCT